MPRPLLLIHGYSATGLDFKLLRQQLLDRKIDAEFLNVGNYISLNNEVTIEDIAEGLERAISLVPKLQNEEEFDAIVHSTGMLVVRSWLAHQKAAANNARLKRLKHLIGLAPATWGSPQAQKGRTWLGALVKGSKIPGPDFLNAGDKVLDGLELGSKFTWDLAHMDLLGEKPYFGPGNDTPYVAVFIGNTPYDGIAEVANDPGTDGTVRWAGCGLNTRKITLDLTETPKDARGEPRNRVTISDWANDSRLNIPILPVEGRNHGTLISDPVPEMVDRVASFLNVSDADGYNTWLADAQEWSAPAFKKMKQGPGHLFHLWPEVTEGWQQFVVHARDTHSNPVSDYVIEVYQKDEDGGWERCKKMALDAHAYGADSSYRCIQVQLPQGITSGDFPIQVQIQASTGTKIMAYQGYGTDDNLMEMRADSEPVKIEISGPLKARDATLFHPFTTTLVEIILNRAPYPFGVISDIFQWWKFDPPAAANN